MRSAKSEAVILFRQARWSQGRAVPHVAAAPQTARHGSRSISSSGLGSGGRGLAVRATIAVCDGRSIGASVYRPAFISTSSCATVGETFRRQLSDIYLSKRQLRLSRKRPRLKSGRTHGSASAWIWPGCTSGAFGAPRRPLIEDRARGRNATGPVSLPPQPGQIVHVRP